MRLSVLRNVDLPQPDGPMSAVTWLTSMLRETPLRAWKSPYQRLTFSAVIFILLYLP